MKEKIVLQGVFQTFTPTNNGRIYDIKDYQKFLDEFNRKELYKKRKEIAEKILKICE